MIGLGLLACVGWVLAASVYLRARRRRRLVADAEHELRGAAAAIGLAAERMARDGSTAAFAWLVRLQLDRMTGALADLSGTSAAQPELDAARLAQVLGNLVANATEHGVGPVEVRTSRAGGRVRVEIRNRDRPRELDELAGPRRPGRGRGLAIAERATQELGGSLLVERREGETRAALELPAERGGAPPPDARRAA